MQYFFQNIPENTVVSIYPYKMEVTADVFHKNPDMFNERYSYERIVGPRMIQESNGTCKKIQAGSYVFTPTENTQVPPYGHIFNHCRTHANLKVIKLILK